MQMRKLTPGGVLEIGCWSAGAVLLGLYFGVRAHGEVGRRDAIEQFEHAVAAAPRSADQRREILDDDTSPDMTHWSDGRIRAWRAAAEPAGSKPLPAAVLRIRGVALEVPVYGDAGERNLNRGAGLVEGTASPGSDGNVAIAAHRDGYFRALEGIEIGDLMELESLSGRRTYRVSELSIVEPTELWPLDPTPVAAVTLVTCFPFYFVGSAPQRYIVRAVAVDGV
jgi:sortase A